MWKSSTLSEKMSTYLQCFVIYVLCGRYAFDWKAFLFQELKGWFFSSRNLTRYAQQIILTLSNCRWARNNMLENLLTAGYLLSSPNHMKSMRIKSVGSATLIICPSTRNGYQNRTNPVTRLATINGFLWFSCAKPYFSSSLVSFGEF